MKPLFHFTQFAWIGIAVFLIGCATPPTSQVPKMILGAVCETPPPLHCPDTGCTLELIGNRGNATDPKTGRQFFLDYPCDLKPGEKVTFILNLHGGGSIGNWQRHYFPIMDLKDKYRLVVATPSGVERAWIPENDDAHLENIVNSVYDAFGKENIKAFWLAGHSQGGQTSNRLLTKDFYKEKLTGWVSLSGGRLGSKRSEVRASIPQTPGATPPQPRPTGEGASQRPRGLVAYAEILPDYKFSHIYTSGEHELPKETGLPNTSPWAEKSGCDGQQQLSDIVDTKAGYVQDTRGGRQNPVWGREARPGKARVYVYPNCDEGRIVADIIRMDKGHTEGLEPNVTEEIVKMMMSVSK